MFYDEPDRSYPANMNPTHLVPKKSGAVQDLISEMKDWVWAGGVMVTLVLWFGRLEWRGRQTKTELSEEIKARTKSLEDLERRLDNQRNEDREQHTLDWQRMYGAIETVQRDIKELLQRTGK